MENGCLKEAAETNPDLFTYAIANGANAFKGTESLRSVTILENVQAIESGAFSSCLLLREVSLSEGLRTIAGYAYPTSSNMSNGAFSYCARLQSITIPGAVTSIGGYAFYNDSSLATIRIKAPSGDITVADTAFNNCPGSPVSGN